ncbi:phosphatidate cytidylyltransferase [Salinibacter altiplanensis]|uniref:phosphatidate cytidylyltransferase n=1 Tax=Salinibacter altiplanensis TaxID=1803181 RepID=UPI000C9F57D5|nr:phosphatidate cytidylyltransferase [Salinibacter altiplanensis]
MPASSLSYTGEVGRKALHLLALSIPFGAWGVGLPTALYLLAPAALAAIAADVARAYSESVNTIIRWTFGGLMRAEELPATRAGIRFNGATCVLVSAALMVFLFPLRIAVPVLVMAMLADAAAALVGRRWGHHAWGTRSATVEGTAAFVGTGLGVMAFFSSIAFGPGAAGVLVGAGTEALSLPVNDNIRVPVAAAVAVVAGEALIGGRPVSLLPVLAL